MAKVNRNPHSILFIYEGETEGEFYSKIFEDHLPQRTIQIHKGNLKGVFSLDNKVRNKIQTYLLSDKFVKCKSIHVFVAYDREGDINTEPILDIEKLKREFIVDKSRVKSINQVIATQDLESWFYHDMPGIYKYLRVPKTERKLDVHPNVNATHNRMLSQFFHRYKKHYQKGRRAEGFIDDLDLKKIIGKVVELQEMIKQISDLAK